MDVLFTAVPLTVCKADKFPIMPFNSFMLPIIVLFVVAKLPMTSPIEVCMVETLVVTFPIKLAKSVTEPDKFVVILD